MGAKSELKCLVRLRGIAELNIVGYYERTQVIADLKKGCMVAKKPNCMHVDSCAPLAVTLQIHSFILIRPAATFRAGNRPSRYLSFECNTVL